LALFIILFTLILSQRDVLRKVTGCGSFQRAAFQCCVTEYSVLHTNGSLLAK